MNTTPFNLGRSFWPSLALLGVGFTLFEFTSLDLRLQDHFYNFSTRRWVIDDTDRLARALFYHGPKVALILFAVTLLALVLGPVRWRIAAGFPSPVDRRALIVVLLTLASGPALIGAGKSVTNMFCPCEITRYGGDVPYVHAFECYAPGRHPVRRGHCFPAGHASGGFALMSLAGIGRTRRGQLAGIAIGLGTGGAMGLYQMLKGAHYLSHTVITAQVLWLIFVAWHRFLSTTWKWKRHAAQFDS